MLKSLHIYIYIVTHIQNKKLLILLPIINIINIIKNYWEIQYTTDVFVLSGLFKGLKKGLIIIIINNVNNMLIEPYA